jgi:hypothetical protein
MAARIGYSFRQWSDSEKVFLRRTSNQTKTARQILKKAMHALS